MILFNDLILFVFFSDFNSGNGEPTNETDAVAIQTNSDDFNYITIAGKGIRFINTVAIPKIISVKNARATEGPPVANSLLLPNARNIHCSVIVKVS
jgi:hypothetical protein